MKLSQEAKDKAIEIKRMLWSEEKGIVELQMPEWLAEEKELI